MSQTFFSKLDQTEKDRRLDAIGKTNGIITIWKKGESNKIQVKALKFIAEHQTLVLDTQDNYFSNNASVLCSFEFRGMFFFAEAVFLKSAGDYAVLKIPATLFKSEKRSSYRLMTFPLHEVWAVFDLGSLYRGGKVINLKTRHSNTGLFKNFLNLVDGEDSSASQLRIRVQDLSTTGMALYVGELEAEHFKKDSTFSNVTLKFTDEEVVIPVVKIVYNVPSIGADKKLVKYKLGVQFENLPNSLDHWLGKKINSLLRANDYNKEFENFQK